MMMTRMIDHSVEFTQGNRNILSVVGQAAGIVING